MPDLNSETIKEKGIDAESLLQSNNTYGTSQSDWPFAMADLRAYDRAITDAEIAVLSE